MKANILQIEHKEEAKKLHLLFLFPRDCLGDLCSVATLIQS